MKITFLGTGTSQGIPVIGCGCQVCQSSDRYDHRLRVSVLIEIGETTLVIDSGPDFRYQMLREKVMDLDAILFTHEHKDHIAGLDDIRPFNYILKKKIDIYAAQRVQEALKREFAYIFSEVPYPGLPQINLFTVADRPFEIAGHPVIPIEVLHYKLPVLAYRIYDFTYVTDAKTVSEEAIAKMRGSKVLVVNALQKEPHISHFTLDEAIAFAERVGAETTYFTHISHHLGLHKEVEGTLPPSVHLAYDGLKISL